MGAAGDRPAIEHAAVPANTTIASTRQGEPGSENLVWDIYPAAKLEVLKILTVRDHIDRRDSWDKHGYIGPHRGTMS